MDDLHFVAGLTLAVGGTPFRNNQPEFRGMHSALRCVAMRHQRHAIPANKSLHLAN